MKREEDTPITCVAAAAPIFSANDILLFLLSFEGVSDDEIRHLNVTLKLPDSQTLENKVPTTSNSRVPRPPHVCDTTSHSKPPPQIINQYQALQMA